MFPPDASCLTLKEASTGKVLNTTEVVLTNALNTRATQFTVSGSSSSRPRSRPRRPSCGRRGPLLQLPLPLPPLPLLQQPS